MFARISRIFRKKRIRPTAVIGLSAGVALIFIGFDGCGSRRSPANAPVTVSEESRVRDLMRRIAAHPDDRDARLQLAQLHEENGHFMAALEVAAGGPEVGFDGMAALRGRCLARVGRLPEAESQLARALDVDPRSARTAVELARVMAARGKSRAAGERLRSAAKNLRAAGQMSGAPGDAMFLAEAFYDLGDQDLAREWAETAIRNAPSVPDGYLLSGRILLDRGHAAEAAGRFARAADLRPEDPAARELQGDALAGLGPVQGAALDKWLEAIELRSTRPDTYYRAATALEKRGDYARAAQVTMRAALRTGELSRAFSRAAALWERAGDPEQALYCRATAAAARRQYAAALPLYRRLAQNRNLEWKSRGLQGAAEMMRLLNRPEEYLQAARQAADGSAVSEIRIANAYLLIGDQKQREAHLRRALAKDPSTAGAVYLELAGQAENKGHKEEAIALLRQAVKSSPADAQAWLAVSRLSLSLGGARAAREAVEAAAQAAAAEPQNQEAFRELGRACAASGDHLRAKQAFQHAIDLDPRNPESYELLARELRALGDNEAATDSESRARRLRLENNARRPRKTGPKS